MFEGKALFIYLNGATRWQELHEPFPPIYREVVDCSTYRDMVPKEGEDLHEWASNQETPTIELELVRNSRSIPIYIQI